MILSQKISEKVGNPKTGALLKFAKLTGLSYETLRKWITRPVIPFLLAEFLVIWLDVKLEDLREWGIQISTQTRKSRDVSGITILKIPNLSYLSDKRFICVVTVLNHKGYRIAFYSQKKTIEYHPPTTISTERKKRLYKQMKADAQLNAEINAKKRSVD